MKRYETMTSDEIMRVLAVAIDDDINCVGCPFDGDCPVTSYDDSCDECCRVVFDWLNSDVEKKERYKQINCGEKLFEYTEAFEKYCRGFKDCNDCEFCEICHKKGRSFAFARFLCEEDVETVR